MLVFEFQIAQACVANVLVCSLYSVHDSEHVTCLNRWLYVLDIYIYLCTHFINKPKPLICRILNFRCRHSCIMLCDIECLITVKTIFYFFLLMYEWVFYSSRHSRDLKRYVPGAPHANKIYNNLFYIFLP